MKISKKRLQRIIKEERAKLLQEGEQIKRASIGFAGFAPNRNPDFAKAYGKDAKVMGQYRNNNKDLREQPMPAPSSDPVETAFQELKFSGAYKDLQTSLHDSLVDLEGLFEKHSDMMVQADQGSLLDDLQEVMANLDNLRQTFHALR
jgi:hypothetical protein